MILSKIYASRSYLVETRLKILTTGYCNGTRHVTVIVVLCNYYCNDWQLIASTTPTRSLGEFQSKLNNIWSILRERERAQQLQLQFAVVPAATSGQRTQHSHSHKRPDRGMATRERERKSDGLKENNSSAVNLATCISTF